MNEDGIVLTPEYIAKHSFNAQVREAQRIRVWTAAYAAVIGAIVNDQTSTHTDDSVVAAQVADIAVKRFDEAWGLK